MGQKVSRPRSHDSAATNKVLSKAIVHARHAPEAQTIPSLFSNNALHIPPTGGGNGFQEIPVELLFEITNCLSPASLLSLSYTCRSLSHALGLSVNEELGKPKPCAKVQMPDNRFQDSVPQNRAPVSPQPWNVQDLEDTMRPERLELLCMLDRDGMWPGKSICSACTTVHNKSSFSQESLQQSNSTRQCLGSQGRIWICPHIQTDYFELKALCNFPVTKAKRAVACPGICEGEEAWMNHMNCPEDLDSAGAKTGWWNQNREREAAKEIAALEREKWTICEKCNITVLTTSWANSRIWFPLNLELIPGSIIPEKDVASDLSRLDAPICPHMKLSSPIVLAAYSQECKRLESIPRDSSEWAPCPCRACLVPYHECPICHAKFGFDFKRAWQRDSVLHIFVDRSFSPFKAITDPAWIAQLVPQHRFQSLEHSWRATVRLMESSAYGSVQRRCSGHDYPDCAYCMFSATESRGQGSCC